MHLMNTKVKKRQKKIELSFIVEKKNSKLEDILKESTIISKAVNKARDMVNSAPADFYPQIMAQMAQKISARCRYILRSSW